MNSELCYVTLIFLLQNVRAGYVKPTAKNSLNFGNAIIRMQHHGFVDSDSACVRYASEPEMTTAREHDLGSAQQFTPMTCRKSHIRTSNSQPSIFSEKHTISQIWPLRRDRGLMRRRKKCPQITQIHKDVQRRNTIELYF
jgi:hypothetical protein